MSNAIKTAYEVLVAKREVKLKANDAMLAETLVNRVRDKYSKQLKLYDKKYPDVAEGFDMYNKSITYSYDDVNNIVHIKLVSRKKPVKFEIVT